MGFVHSGLAGFTNIIWLMAIVLFVLGTYISLTTEKGEMHFSNLLIIVLMYVTYTKLWMVVACYGLVMYIRDVLLKKETKWYKTERF